MLPHIVTNSRVIFEIERTLRRGTSMPHIKYNKYKIEGYKREVQEILDTLDIPNLSPGRNPSMDELNGVTTPISEGGASCFPSSPIFYRIPIASLLSSFSTSTLQPVDA